MCLEGLQQRGGMCVAGSVIESVKIRLRQGWHIRCSHSRSADWAMGMSSAPQVRQSTSSGGCCGAASTGMVERVELRLGFGVRVLGSALRLLVDGTAAAGLLSRLEDVVLDNLPAVVLLLPRDGLVVCRGCERYARPPTCETLSSGVNSASGRAVEPRRRADAELESLPSFPTPLKPGTPRLCGSVAWRKGVPAYT